MTPSIYRLKFCMSVLLMVPISLNLNQLKVTDLVVIEVRFSHTT